MKNITVYDEEAKKIEKICDERDTTSAELIEVFIDIIEAGDINLDDYM